MPVAKFYEVGGRTLTLRQWAADPDVRARGLNYIIIRNRIVQGWTPEDALLLPRHRRRGERGIQTTIGSDDVPYALDAVAVAFVEQHPGGATLEEVGVVFGVSRERIRQIEEKALRKLRLILAEDPDAEETLLTLLGRHSPGDG